MLRVAGDADGHIDLTNFSREFIDAGEPEVGAIMLFTAMDGSEMPGVIREVNGDSITVDFNHPLAGRTVHFDVEVLEIDPALEG